MAKNVDIIDVMLAVKNGKFKILVKNGFFLLEDTLSGECVRLNEVDSESRNEARKVFCGADMRERKDNNDNR